MNILFFTHNSPWHAPVGGVSTYLSELIPYLLDQGHTVHVLSYVLEDEDLNNEDISHDNLHIHYANTYPYRTRQKIASILPQSFSAIIHPPYILNAMREAFQSLTNKHDFDIIETVPYEGLGLIPYYYSDQPVILRLHLSPTTHPTTLETFAQESYLKWFFFKARAYLSKKTAEVSNNLVANSHTTKQYVQRAWNTEDITTIHPPVSPPDLNNSLNLDHEFILSCGRITTGKGFGYIPKTAVNVLKQHPDLHLYIIGRGSNHSAPTTDDTVLNRIHYTGQIPRNKLLQYMEAAKCVVLGSIWEPFGYVCAEAMMMGSVVIATEGSGFEEQIDHGHNGYLFRRFDEDQLETLLSNVLTMQASKRRALTKQAKKRAKQFHPEIVAEKQLNVYKELAD